MVLRGGPLWWVILTACVATAAAKECCKICSKGVACGDTCISKGQTCHKEKTKGCACDAATCCKFCETGKPCGDGCIAERKTCKKPAGCACGPQGAEQSTTDTSQASSWKDWSEILKEAVKAGGIDAKTIMKVVDLASTARRLQKQEGKSAAGGEM
eukprot:TRINITY_DN10382_c0_g1_i1.p1 TRINITY_DN10382_c0_g1~~TRINITY_DN10382_c0_g1_i1.p1  ORF type:complete len:156 (+),score=37.90 TRINITY_DN10382_c0_g1_i1:82-549(+)